MEYESIIGLEIHAELKTKTKMFCYSANDPDEKHPNMNICPVCMGHPGTLPVINQEAVKKVITVGLALNGKIAEFSQFDRKNYFYPDLPKGYQISQYKHPLVEGGFMDVGGRRIRITRIHLEEDTGKLIHDAKIGVSLVDFNRAGVPLMELVTEPDFRTGDEIIEFGENFQQILRYLGASDADMEKGEMRVEVNISLRHPGDKLGTKVEIKNINSFKFAADAAEYETKRQGKLLDQGEKIKQETRGWNENKNETFSQRSKEEAHDYRYFPEPDLPPLNIARELVEELQANIPELPKIKLERFVKEYGLEKKHAKILVREKMLADYYEKVVSELRQHDKETPEKLSQNLEKLAVSFLTGEFLAYVNEDRVSLSEIMITPENMAELLIYIAEDKISNLAAKEVFKEMMRLREDPSDVIDRLKLWQVSGKDELEKIIKQVLEENPNPAKEYKNGKAPALQFLVGRVMKKSQGKANPKVVQELIKKLLG